MSFTRFHDDPCRIQKQLQESTGPGRYMINVPGNGLKPCFMADPYMRMQKWGANLMTESIDLESRLRGMDRNLDKDCTQYDNKPIKSKRVSYLLASRLQIKLVLPTLRGPHVTYLRLTGILPLNPQENTCMPFQNNLSTRILEKDSFVPKAPCPELLK